MNEPPPLKIPVFYKRLGLVAFFILILAVMAYKAYDDGWFLPRTPLVLNGQPAILFFNRHKGCDCALVVYNAAARQIEAWPAAQRQGVQLIQVDLDRRPDLGEQFEIIRAPSLLLLDADGNTIYRQDEAITDLEPLDLPMLERKIQKVIDRR